MSKGLEALNELHCVAYGMKKYDEQTIKSEEVIEKYIEVIELIESKGIKLIIPENEFSNEHIDIQVFTRHLRKEEFELIKEVLDL